MKQTDIKRIEKVAELLQKAAELLSKTYDSLEKQPTEYFHFGTSGTKQSYISMINEMYKEVVLQRNYIAGKVKVFKENAVNNEENNV